MLENLTTRNTIIIIFNYSSVSFMLNHVGFNVLLRPNVEVNVNPFVVASKVPHYFMTIFKMINV